MSRCKYYQEVMNIANGYIDVDRVLAMKTVGASKIEVNRINPANASNREGEFLE